jgi:catechol 2,3-dioxygenase-like lactoylglutathione lyase family enzyme
MTDVRLAALCVPGEAGAWRDLGFAIVDDAIALANGAIRLGADECSLELEPAGRDVSTVDGVLVTTGAGVDAVVHPNGAVELDHVVVMTDSIERTSAAIEELLGLEQRRLRETDTVRQAFHRFADAPDGTRGCIVEVVERPDVTSVGIWGVVVVVDEIDRAVAEAGGRIGTPKPAVQPGRRIASVPRAAGLSLAVAVMSR